MRLFIIGNGFDLNHGMETAYYDFRKYLIKKNISVKDFEHNDYLPNPIGENWSDIETHLQIDYEQLMDNSTNAYYPNLMDESDSRWHNLAIEIEIRTELSNIITHQHFTKWISSINPSDYEAKFDLNKEDLYVTFNYTKLLEVKYGIYPFHIHGSVDDSIQFGNFDNNPNSIVEELRKLYGGMEWYSVSIDPALENLCIFLKNTFKNYVFNKKQLLDYLGNKRIDEVIIMGHSYDGIDKEYYNDVFLNYKCLWTFYCHNTNEEKKAISFANKHCLIYKLINW